MNIESKSPNRFIPDCKAGTITESLETIENQLPNLFIPELINKTEQTESRLLNPFTQGVGEMSDSSK
jgi:hypothetical protein